MWCNSWVLKDFISIVFKILLACGGIYWAMYAFAWITHKISKKNKRK